MKKLIVAFFVFLVVACTARPHLSTQAIEIKRQDLPQYWQMNFESFTFRSPMTNANLPKGYVKVRFLIDSNGKTFNPEIVESVPVGVWDNQGLRAVKQLEYSPSKTNIARTPVYVTIKFDFESTKRVNE